MRISDWSSDVCSSDLVAVDVPGQGLAPGRGQQRHARIRRDAAAYFIDELVEQHPLRRERAAGQVCAVAAQLHEQQPRTQRGGAAVQAHHHALAADARAAGSAAGAEKGEADALDRKSARLKCSHQCATRMTSSACNKQNTNSEPKTTNTQRT